MNELILIYTVLDLDLYHHITAVPDVLKMSYKQTNKMVFDSFFLFTPTTTTAKVIDQVLFLLLNYSTRFVLNTIHTHIHTQDANIYRYIDVRELLLLL